MTSKNAARLSASPLIPFRTRSEVPPIGQRIHSIRTQRGWTLRDVSEQTGIPVSALSKLENGKQSMSYPRLLRLAEIFGIELGELLAGEAKPGAVPASTLGRRSIARAGDANTVEDATFADLYLASDLLNKKMTPVLCETRLSSLEQWGDWSRHDGEELVYVLEGTLDFRTELYAPLLLQAGDSIYFDAAVGHAYLTTSSQSCRFLSVCQSPSRQRASAIQKLEPQGRDGGFEGSSVDRLRLTPTAIEPSKR